MHTIKTVPLSNEYCRLFMVVLASYKQIAAMIRSLMILLISVSLTACNDDAKQSGTDTPLGKLFSEYEALKLPFNMADSALKLAAKKDTASLSLFRQVVADTVLSQLFSTEKKLRLFPVGKIEQKEKESYLLSRIVGQQKSVLLLTVFDKGKFTTSMALLVSDNDDVLNTAAIDKKLSVVINREWTTNNNFFYDRIIYAYNNVGVFTTVLTETNEERAAARGIVNPLDTFPARLKYSGDYSLDSKNVLFIRDGAGNNQYLFYIYFENESGGQVCKGEAKGRLNMVTEKEGTFTGSNDPCVLNFSFAGNQVKVKETGTCGNYRGIKCFFNHSFTKKKSTANTTGKK